MGAARRCGILHKESACDEGDVGDDEIQNDDDDNDLHLEVLQNAGTAI